jgi:hypothetical protein
MDWEGQRANLSGLWVLRSNPIVPSVRRTLPASNLGGKGEAASSDNVAEWDSLTVDIRAARRDGGVRRERRTPLRRPIVPAASLKT